MADSSNTGPAPAQKWAPAAPEESAGLDENGMIQFLMPAEKLGSRINTRSFNELLDRGIPFILTNLFNVAYRVKDVRDKTPMDRKRESVEIKLRFSDVKIGRPTYSDYPFGKIKPMYPHMARLQGLTYASVLSLAAEVTLTAHYAQGETKTLTAKVPPFPLAKIPIMVGCNRCHTWNLPREARKYLKEDPNENGGYFLAKGGEWVVQWLENVRYNFLHVHERTKSGEKVRGEFLSQPGGAFENSSQIIIRYMDSGALTIEINNPNFAKTKIPFYIVFRLLGMTSDTDVVDSIAYGFSAGGAMDQETSDIVEILDRAFRHEDKTFKDIRHEMDRAELVRYIAERLSSYISNTRDYLKVENSIRYLNTNLIRILDTNFLPHLGVGASKRGEKLRFLGSLIRGTLQVALGIMPPTDRDNYANKRVHGAGVSIAKAIKTQFNSGVVKPIINSLRQSIRHTEFEKLRAMDIVKLVQTKATSVNLGRTLEQAITSGEGKIRINRKVLTNRVSSQALERKNPSNYLSAMRGLSAHAGSNKASKQTARADEMRRVHPSFPGYVCIVKSADTGEKVGMNKELALSATVCGAGQPFNLVGHLRKDPDLIPLSEVRLVDIARLGLSRVYVNGGWVGCAPDALSFVARYRALRRESRVVDPQASIIWYPVTGDVHFCLDVGRLTRPLLIVDNNLAEYKRDVRAGKKGARFLQTVRLTPAHVKNLAAGLTTLENLRQEGIFEWVSAGEAENTLVAPSIDVLRGHVHNPLHQYTHCDVPQSLMGITAHLSPYGNHTQMARVTYETNQGRSSGGWYSLAAPFRADKGRFFQYYIEYPLVHTLTAGRVLPSSSMTMVAYMFLKGYNQEDSGIIKLSYAQRHGFAGVYSTKMEAVLGNGEKFGTPDPLLTKNMKPDASYEKLEGEAVPKGTVLRRGDVVIGVVAQESGRGEEKYKYVDRSVVYYNAEPATVTEVYKTHDSIGNEKIIVTLSYHREITVGDKLSSRSGNKMIVAIIVPDADMPYNDRGVTPDIVVNPHCLAGDTPIATGDGLARPISSFAAEGGEVVWGLAPGARIAPARSCGLLPKADEQPVSDFYLEDGRCVRATDGHPFLAAVGGEDPQWVRAGELTPEHRVVCGLDLPLDVPRPDEAGWTLDLGAGIAPLGLATAGERDRALAFSRLLGLVVSDGCLSLDKRDGCWRGNVALGCRADCEAALADIETLTGRRPRVADVTPYCIALPRALTRAMGDLPGVPTGRNVLRAPEWPAFLDDAPVAVLREFLGGLFGGDGHAPCLVKNKASATTLRAQSLSRVAISFTTTEGHLEAMVSYMDKLCAFLARVGVPGCLRNTPVRRAANGAIKAKNTEGSLRRVQVKVTCPPTTAFATCVGFRYCAQKALRLSAANAYWRYLENIKRQHAAVIGDTIKNAQAAGVTRKDARDDAVRQLTASEPLVNLYYADPPITLVNNRFRGDRQKTLGRLDFARSGVLRPRAFFERTGCLDWFYVEGLTGTRRTYVAGREDTALATFTLGFLGKRARGVAPVYDLTVPGPTSFVAAGVVVHNSIPSRMTIGQLLEGIVSYLCMIDGTLVDGTSYRRVDPKRVARQLEAAGARYSARERMYNGQTGEYYDAAIVMAPTASQRILKFVADDKYVAPAWGPTNATTQQPLPGKNARGGLRVGEMEVWVLDTHGAMANLIEKLYNDSDGQKYHLCRKCGHPAIYNPYRSIYRCRRCGEGADVCSVDSCHAVIVALEEMRSANFDIELKVRPFEFEEGVADLHGAAR